MLNDKGIEEYDAEKCEVVSVRLARRGNNDVVLVLSCRLTDNVVEEYFVTLQNAHRVQGDINHLLQSVHFRPEVIGDVGGLRRFMKHKGDAK